MVEKIPVYFAGAKEPVMVTKEQLERDKVEWKQRVGYGIWKKKVKRPYRVVKVSKQEIYEVIRRLLMEENLDMVLLDAVVKVVCEIKGTNAEKRVRAKTRKLVQGLKHMELVVMDGREWIVMRNKIKEVVKE